MWPLDRVSLSDDIEYAINVTGNQFGRRSHILCDGIVIKTEVRGLPSVSVLDKGEKETLVGLCCCVISKTLTSTV